jgi:hypothetical protein
MLARTPLSFACEWLKKEGILAVSLVQKDREN